MHRGSTITFVDDEDMPEGHDFLLVTENGQARLFYRRSALTERTLAQSWKAYRRLVGIEKDPPPALRMAI
jgi:hypothetical protein